MLTELRRADLLLVLAVAGLVTFGSLMVHSASFVLAFNEFGDGTYFFSRHLAWIGLGVLLLMAAAAIDYHFWRRLALPLFLASLVLLIFVLVKGDATYGSSRWLAIGPLAFQPSEFTKLALVIYLASWLARMGGGIQVFSAGTVPFTLILGLTLGLVLLEPDLGTAAILAMTAASIFFIAGANVLHALGGALLAAATLAILVGFMRLSTDTGYWSGRIAAWLDPWSYASDIGYQTIQTLLALASGGPQGLGLGAGRQKYYYVPNAHTDGIFAIIGEELGFIGTAGILILFLLIAWRGLRVAASARDPLGRLLAAGVTTLLVCQALLNMAVITSAVPYTGVPLPLVSYGGSAMLTSLAAIGILLSVSRANNRGSPSPPLRLVR